MKLHSSCLVIILSFISQTVFANSYCYDDVIQKLAENKRALKECDQKLKLNPFDHLAQNFGDWSVFKLITGKYQSKIISSTHELYRLYELELPFNKSTRNNKCIQNELTKFDALKVEILNALITCAAVK